MADQVFVVGVGMTKFEKPGRRPEWDYPDMAREAGGRALRDCGTDYADVQEAYVGYAYGQTCSGQRAVYELGETGIPVFNVNNACATGSSALYLAARAIRTGEADCVLALGFEKMQPGSLDLTSPDRAQPQGRHADRLAQLGDRAEPTAPWMFGAAGVEHMEWYGSRPEHFARIAEKNHRHSANNPYAQFQTVYSEAEIMADRMVYAPMGLTRLQCSPTSDGSAAAVLASARFVEQRGLESQAVEIVGQALVTDMQSSFASDSAQVVVGFEMSQAAVRAVYDQAQLGPDDIDVIELHDCFSSNELITYEALGLCERGMGHELVDAGQTTYGGRWVVNPSGGLISKGHPLGATGLAQCAELTWQLRGTADARQVPEARTALAHNIGIGGAAVVTAFRPAQR